MGVAYPAEAAGGHPGDTRPRRRVANAAVAPAVAAFEPRSWPGCAAPRRTRRYVGWRPRSRSRGAGCGRWTSGGCPGWASRSPSSRLSLEQAEQEEGVRLRRRPAAGAGAWSGDPPGAGRGLGLIRRLGRGPPRDGHRLRLADAGCASSTCVVDHELEVALARRPAGSRRGGSAPGVTPLLRAGGRARGGRRGATPRPRCSTAPSARPSWTRPDVAGRPRGHRSGRAVAQRRAVRGRADPARAGVRRGARCWSCRGPRGAPSRRAQACAGTFAASQASRSAMTSSRLVSLNTSCRAPG